MNEALGLIHKQPGAEQGLRLLAFDLVAREASCSFFSGKKNQKPRDQKNSLILPGFNFFSVLLSR